MNEHDRVDHDFDDELARQPAFDELDETLRHERGEEAPTAEVARELFAHGLLSQRAERLNPGHGIRREARVRAILARVDGPEPATASSTDTTNEATRTGSDAQRLRLREPTRGLKLAISLAAAALVVLAVVFWPRRDWTPMFADQLVERAALATQSGVHVYEVRLVHQSSRRGQRSQLWHVALAPERRFHAKLIEGERPLLSVGSEIGSDGKSLWARSRTGQTFDMPFDTSSIVQRLTLEPELSYYQLRPLLRSVFQGLEFEVDGVRVKRSGGREITLAGKYVRKVEERRKPRRRSEQRRRKSRRGEQRRRSRSSRSPTTLLGTHGEIRLVIDEDSGMLLSLNASESAPRARRLDLRRLDIDTKGFDFDPPRIRSAARVSSKAWARLAARGAWQIWRRLWARKPKSSSESDKR